MIQDSLRERNSVGCTGNAQDHGQQFQKEQPHVSSECTASSTATDARESWYIWVGEDLLPGSESVVAVAGTGLQAMQYGAGY